jgi:hypothetical protein
MMFPLVRDLAAEGIPVRLTCRVLGFSPQAFLPVARQARVRAGLVRRTRDELDRRRARG